MEVELWIPYEREEAPGFDLDDFLDELDNHVKRLDRLDQGVKVLFSGVVFADKNNLGVGVSMKTQDGYTVPEAEITQVSVKEHSEPSPDPENEFRYHAIYTAHGPSEERIKASARAFLSSDLSFRDVGYRILSEQIEDGETPCVEFEVAIPTSETDNLSAPQRIFATAEEVWFAEKE